MGPVLLSLTILFAPGCKKKGDTEPVVTAPPSPAVTEAPPPPVAEPTKQSASLSRVYFDFDSSSLSGSSKSSLGKNASVMNDHSSVKVEVQGHCDERGTTEYNLALGQRRAAAGRQRRQTERAARRRRARPGRCRDRGSCRHRTARRAPLRAAR